MELITHVLLQSGKGKQLTFPVMSSHCVPLPDAGAPDIIIFSGLESLPEAITCQQETNYNKLMPNKSSYIERITKPGKHHNLFTKRSKFLFHYTTNRALELIGEL